MEKFGNMGLKEFVQTMTYTLNRDEVLGARDPLLSSQQFLGVQPPMNVQSLKIFLKLFCFAQDLQTHFNICTQYKIAL